MRLSRNRKPLVVFFLAITSFSCGKEPVPKPRGYFRIDLPEKQYHIYDDSLSLRFMLPEYSAIQRRTEGSRDSSWFNIRFPNNNASIYCTYRKINGPLENYLEDAHFMAFSHEIRANAIERTRIARDSARVYGLVYDIKGDVASSLQFYVTDSTRNFLRGSLYFENPPNADSTGPVLSFIRADLLHLINTLEWQDQ